MDKLASAFPVALVLFSFSQFLPRGVQAEDVAKRTGTTPEQRGMLEVTSIEQSPLASPGPDIHILQGPEVCEDARINVVHPDRNSGPSSTFSVFRSNAPIRSLIRFDLSRLGKDTTAKDVVLMMYMVGEKYAGMNHPMVLEAYAVAADWREDEVTWRHRTRDQEWQTAGGHYDHENVLVASDIPAPFGKGWIALKGPALTRMVNLWITGQKPNHGLLLRRRGEPGGPSMKSFVSSENRDTEHRAYRPKLIISTDRPVDPADHGFVSDLATKLVKTLVNMAEPQLEKLREGRRRGLLELKPIVLPVPEYVVGKNNHFGWPLATKAGDALVVIYLRRCSHYVPPPWDEDSSGCMMIRSLDGGRSWSKPTDLRQYARNEDGSLPYYSKGECLITARDGAIVLGHEVGTFRSEDNGETWEHFAYEFGRRLSNGEVTTLNCPRLIEHPQYGLVRMSGTKLKPKFPGWPRFSRNMHVAYSQDGGRTWQEQMHEVPIVAGAEPAMLLHEGALIIVGRPYDKTSYDAKSFTSNYIQHWSKSGWFPLQTKYTNMRTTDRLKSGRWGEGLDTVDLSFNPLTERFEVVATDRQGGGVDGRFREVPFTLNLWSIDPQALLAGSADWRFEGCLFERQVSMTPTNAARMADGSHPAAAVIDEKEGVQHVFVYLGSPAGPAGIFHLKRTLDTPKLAAFLKE